MSEDIRRAFNNKDFSYISEAAKIRTLTFEQLFHKFNNKFEKPKKYKGYRVIAMDGFDFSSLYNAFSQCATINNQYGTATGLKILAILFAYATA